MFPEWLHGKGPAIYHARVSVPDTTVPILRVLFKPLSCKVFFDLPKNYPKACPQKMGISG
jgi:hypothetical protein